MTTLTSTNAVVWEELMNLSPLCSGSLHEQYLKCGKGNCSCHASAEAPGHGPYYLWVRRIGGKQVNRTLRAGPELERVRKGIANYERMQQLIRKVVAAAEREVLAADRAVAKEGKKNSKRRLKQP